jgi:MFS transporter, FHS family, Na+ dependent glucose transporter 1
MTVTRLRSILLGRTLAYYLLFGCLGLGLGLVGPTLPALGAQTHTPLARLGLVFLAGSLGYTAGTVLGGRLFDRWRGHPLLGGAQLAAGASLALVPFVPWLWVLLLVLFIMGVADGIINTGANTLLVWSHSARVGPYMNGLHFAFGAGAFLSPLLVAQFAGQPEGYRWAFWVVAAVSGLVGLRLLALPAHAQPVRPRDDPRHPAGGGPVPVGLVVAAGLLLFFYVGAEIGFSGWLYTYAVRLNLAGPAQAAYLTSGFWLTFTIGRLLSIPLAVRFRSGSVILAGLLGCLVLLAALSLVPGSHVVLWVAALGLGFCLAPIWPTSFTLASQSVNLTARLSGLILLGDSAGGMFLPAVAGLVVQQAGPAAVVWLVLGSVVCDLGALAGLLWYRRQLRDLETPTAVL